LTKKKPRWGKAGAAHIQRRSKLDELDYYPTQPWVTRALMEVILPRPKIRSVWEPACGGGHMAEVLREYDIGTVFASDIHDYGYGQVSDFLTGPRVPCDWIITNPPYAQDRAEKFALRALSNPGTMGVAMLCRNNWLEGGQRYERLFAPHPPTIVAVILDRVGFHKGTCEVGRSGMMPYSWFIWDKGSTITNQIRWVPAKTRDLLTKPDDAERFNHPLVKRK
jgi:hypothetical protein